MVNVELCFHYVITVKWFLREKETDILTLSHWQLTASVWDPQ